MIINHRYKCDNLVGKGQFGEVFKGHIIKTGEYVAIKMEPKSLKLLKHEATLLNYLAKKSCHVVPILYWFGNVTDFTCIVMNYFEQSLDDYIKQTTTDGKVEVSKIDKIMAAMINCCSYLHYNSIVHRDIKPQNFMFNYGHQSNVDPSKRKLYIIDLGLANFFVADGFIHVENTNEQTNIIGNPKYVSYYVHDKCIPVRRDDLISIGYIYLQMYYGYVAWEDFSRIAHIKDDTPEISVDHVKNKYRKQVKDWKNMKNICMKTNNKIFKYMETCYQLEFSETPRYQRLIEYFTTTTSDV